MTVEYNAGSEGLTLYLLLWHFDISWCSKHLLLSFGHEFRVTFGMFSNCTERPAYNNKNLLQKNSNHEHPRAISLLNLLAFKKFQKIRRPHPHRPSLLQHHILSISFGMSSSLMNRENIKKIKYI